MKCLVPSCRDSAQEGGRDRPAASPFHFCKDHRHRFNRAYQRRWKDKSHFGEEARYASWVATWLQMVDAELLSEVVAPVARPKPWPGYDKMPPTPLPEEATRAGQQAIAKRDKEQAALEAQLDSDTAEYRRGRRMELELELRTKRAEAELKARKATA